MRHAIAAERGDDWPDDNKRPLTERGISRFKESVGGLKELDAVIDEIFTSPLVRASRPRDLLAAGVEGRPRVKMLDALAPGQPPATVMAQLAKVAKRRRIALVGHEPDLGELAAHLIGARRPLPFKKGGICRIDVESLSTKSRRRRSSGSSRQRCCVNSLRERDRRGHHQPDFRRGPTAGCGAAACRARHGVSASPRRRRGSVRDRARRTRARAGACRAGTRRVAVHCLGRRRHGERSGLGAGVHQCLAGDHSERIGKRLVARSGHSVRTACSVRDCARRTRACDRCRRDRGPAVLQSSPASASTRASRTSSRPPDSCAAASCAISKSPAREIFTRATHAYDDLHRRQAKPIARAARRDRQRASVRQRRAHRADGAHRRRQARCGGGGRSLTVVPSCRHAPKLFRGRVGDVPGVTMSSATRVEITRDEPLMYHVDGEPFAGGSTVSAHIRPGALRVRVGNLCA